MIRIERERDYCILYTPEFVSKSPKIVTFELFNSFFNALFLLSMLKLPGLSFQKSSKVETFVPGSGYRDHSCGLKTVLTWMDGGTERAGMVGMAGEQEGT